MKILVTGGTGYIGSHTVVELLQAQHQVVILDNLVNSSITVLEKIKQITGKSVQFIQGDIRDRKLLDELFATSQIEAVIHFAGLKAVGESVAKPMQYYDNNVAGSIQLFRAMQQAGVSKLVFSSSATVYGSDAETPYDEEMPLGKGTNPYSSSKIMIEQILIDYCNANPSWSVKTLRYFNPIGAHQSGLIGEAPQGIPNNLLPYITQVAVGKLKQLSVYGDDYPTADGSCMRDYIHVVDLAKGHLCAIDKLEQSGYDAFNLGTGNAVSVLEIINKFQQINKQQIPYQIVARRDGDLAAFCANPAKALKELNWNAKHDLTDMLTSAWIWEQKNNF